MKNIIKTLICAVFVISLVTSPVFCADSLKTAPLKSFFSRFAKPTQEKPVADKNDKNVSNSHSDKLDSKDKKVKKTKKDKSKSGVSKADDAGLSNANVIKGGVALSIGDCVGFAMSHDPNIKIYKNTQRVQKGAVGVAKSGYFPRITGSTGYNLNNTRISNPEDTLNNNNYGLNVGVNQLIWDFGYTNANINMNKFNYEASGYDLAFQVAISTYNVRIAYTTALQARANEDIYERTVKINELNYKRTKAMYDVGLKSKIDVVNADATLTQARIDLLTAQNTYQTALINLNASMAYVDAPEYSIKDTETFNFQKNYSVRNEIDVAYDRKNYNEGSVEAEIKDGAILTSGIEKRDIIKTYKFKPFDLTMPDAIKTAYEKRSDLKSYELIVKAQEESLKVIKRSFYPAINASAGYSLGAYSDYNSNAVAAFAGVSLPTNVNAMSIKNKIEQGKAYLDIAIDNVDKLKMGIYFDVQNYYVNMRQLERRIPLMSKKVEQTLENFELADGRYAVGLGNYIELQQAQTDYNNAQLKFVQAVFDYNVARFLLQKAMGVI